MGVPSTGRFLPFLARIGLTLEWRKELGYIGSCIVFWFCTCYNGNNNVVYHVVIEMEAYICREQMICWHWLSKKLNSLNPSRWQNRSLKSTISACDTKAIFPTGCSLPDILCLRYSRHRRSISEFNSSMVLTLGMGTNMLRLTQPTSPSTRPFSWAADILQKSQWKA